MIQMPKREHYLKFQTSIPMHATRRGPAVHAQVVQAAANHLKALAGAAAYNVEIRAIYQDRGPSPTGLHWRDVLVVIGFDGPLTGRAMEMQIERRDFEFERMAKASSPIDLGGAPKPGGKIILPS